MVSAQPGGCKSVGGPDVGSSFLFSNWPAAAGEWAAKVCTPDIAAAAAVDTAAGGGRGRGTVLKADFNVCLGMSWIFGCMSVSTATWLAVDVVGVDTTGLICRVLLLLLFGPPPKTVVVVAVTDEGDKLIVTPAS